MEGVHDPFGVGAPPLDQRLYPPTAVRRHDLDAEPLLAGELFFEEPAQHLLAPALRGPDQTSPVVVDHDHEVLVALLVRSLVDPYPANAVEAVGPRRPLKVVVDALADAADGMPFDAARLRHGRHGGVHGHPRHPVLERPGEARSRARPWNGFDVNAMLRARDAHGGIFQIALRCPQVERAPPSRLPAPVVDLAGAAACRATALFGLVRADADDDGIGFDAD